jgi:DNA gyrase inhibitor GyrI
MTVDFAWAKVPSLRVAAIRWTGPWSDASVRRQFERVERWAKEHRVRTGRWIFRELGERRWEAAIEVKGSVRASPPVRLRKLPAVSVGRVVFDPDAVSPEVVYHALNDWLKWRRKDRTIRAVVATREVYSGNPWRNPRAWARTEVQFVVRK